jgi:hypothetical protein
MNNPNQVELFHLDPPAFVPYSGLADSSLSWGQKGWRISGLEWTEETGRAGYLLTWSKITGTYPSLRSQSLPLPADYDAYLPQRQVAKRSKTTPDSPF